MSSSSSLTITLNAALSVDAPASCAVASERNEPKALACYQQYHVPGIAMVSVTIAKSGKVSSANVGGALAGTPTGDCVAKAVKTASFKQFKGAAMSIQYPFQLR